MRTLYADFSCFYIYHFILRNLKTEKQRITKNLRFLKIFFIKKKFFSNTTSSRMFTNHMSSNDRNWPVDLFMCRSQITKGMLCNWLHKVIKRVASSWWFLRVVQNLNCRSKLFYFWNQCRKEPDLFWHWFQK